MNFIDQAEVKVVAGKGGDGRLSFRHEKFISKGGPDGGNGGNGGDVILLASNNQNSLAAFRHNKTLKAESGQPGGNKKKHGKSGQDLLIKVPIGTEAKDALGKVVADLTENGQSEVVARGGKGGFGNAHFVSSVRQAPNFAEKGEPGESINLNLELKMLADIGLVGLPNAGKSTLLGAISNAHPKIADYPFTTLNPSVGVVDVDPKSSLLFADIPGLIEGAAEGKGLGHDFLRHIERTSVIVHVVDAYGADIANNYRIIRSELEAYSKQLAKRPEIVVISKCEGLSGEQSSELLDCLRPVVKPRKTKILLISAKSGLGLRELILSAKSVKDSVDSERETSKSGEEIFEYRLTDNSSSWTVEKDGKRRYIVKGESIKHFAQRTDFNNDQAIERLLDILRKRGVINALIKQGIKPGDTIDVAGKGTIVF